MCNLCKYFVSFLLCLSLIACGGDKKKNTMSEPVPSSSNSSSLTSSKSSSVVSSIAMKMTIKYSISITNLTAGQALSPAAIILHKPNYKTFDVGMPASLALEKIAEGGDNSLLLEDANNNIGTFMTTKGNGMILPGKSESITLDINIDEMDKANLSLSLLTMLVNTNDAFTGLNSLVIGNMGIGEMMALDIVAYDSGTELNTESASTVPGPAVKGEGFNPMRDDVPSVVSLHSGAITNDDGLPTSALKSIHRWDNPVARISITRLAP